MYIGWCFLHGLLYSFPPHQLVLLNEGAPPVLPGQKGPDEGSGSFPQATSPHLSLPGVGGSRGPQLTLPGTEG